MKQVDLMFCTFNRLEFTKIALEAIVRNTNWDLIRHFFIYDDGSVDGTREWLTKIGDRTSDAHFHLPWQTGINLNFPGKDPEGPVAAMLKFLYATDEDAAEFVAKIDNDTVVVRDWLDILVDTLQREPKLDLLGIEPFDELEIIDSCHSPQPIRSFRPNPHVGGIGLFRREALTRPYYAPMIPEGRQGFTRWQHTNCPKAGMLMPALPILLLNRVRESPFRELNHKYVGFGWQRDWPGPYNAETAIGHFSSSWAQQFADEPIAENVAIWEALVDDDFAKHLQPGDTVAMEAKGHRIVQRVARVIRRAAHLPAKLTFEMPAPGERIPE